MYLSGDKSHWVLTSLVNLKIFILKWVWINTWSLLIHVFTYVLKFKKTFLIDIEPPICHALFTYTGVYICAKNYPYLSGCYQPLGVYLYKCVHKCKRKENYPELSGLKQVLSV